MYKVEATIRPERLEEVTDALLALGFDEFMVLRAYGHGVQPGTIASYRGVAYKMPFVHQLRVELRVSETALNPVVEGIAAAARTGDPGDGKIFITPLPDEMEIDLDRSAPAPQRQPTPRPILATTSHCAGSQGW
jgi:nitrogen regulatory protein PII